MPWVPYPVPPNYNDDDDDDDDDDDEFDHFLVFYALLIYSHALLTSASQAFSNHKYQE